MEDGCVLRDYRPKAGASVAFRPKGWNVGSRRDIRSAYAARSWPVSKTLWIYPGLGITRAHCFDGFRRGEGGWLFFQRDKTQRAARAEIKKKKYGGDRLWESTTWLSSFPPRSSSMLPPSREAFSPEQPWRYIDAFVCSSIPMGSIRNEEASFRIRNWKGGAWKGWKTARCEFRVDRYRNGVSIDGVVAQRIDGSSFSSKMIELMVWNN